MASFASSSAEAQHPILWAVEAVFVCSVPERGGGTSPPNCFSEKKFAKLQDSSQSTFSEEHLTNVLPI
jgi:hypothetical protein